MSRPAGSASIDEMLAQARSRLPRRTPAQAHDAVANGALLVDIRPGWQRAAEGEVPGALLVERNHLEWRFDPECDARLPQATGYDVEVIVLCSAGYTSSLAADSLRALGLHRATDVIGGFQAWSIQGFPVRSPSHAITICDDSDMHTRQMVTELLHRVAAGEPERIAELYAEQVEWKLDWPPGDYSRTVPWIRHRSTRAGVAEHFQLIAEHHVKEQSSAEISSILVDGTEAVLLGEFRNMAKTTGRSYVAAFALHLTVENGLITRHHVYEDSLAVAQAFTP